VALPQQGRFVNRPCCFYGQRREFLMILFIKHIRIEGPETLGDFFRRKGYAIRTIEREDNAPLPDNIDNVDAVVSLGGPMNVYEEDKYPCLKEEDAFIKRVVAGRIPFLGVCLGGQLLAKACGARVVRSPKEEIGFLPIHLTKDGKGDPLFKGLEEEVGVFQWHGDMFEIPKEGQLLASSEGCPSQAFRAGHCAYGLQFHVEITDKSIREWTGAYFDLKDSVFAGRRAKMLEDYQERKEPLGRVADKIYENFFGIMNSVKPRP
jgi:GMP synthase-like glutamine amidotransferase